MNLMQFQNLESAYNLACIPTNIVSQGEATICNGIIYFHSIV